MAKPDRPTRFEEHPHPWRLFLRESRKVKGYSLFDLAHAYVYARWIYEYIAFGAGTHPLARLYAGLRRVFQTEKGNQETRGAYAVSREANTTDDPIARTYHGKVLPLGTARELVSVKEDIRRPDLERVLPYGEARDLILLHPDHLAVIDCPCRAAREHPCLPLDVCLIVGEPFVSLVLEKHPTRARKITPSEAVRILEEEDGRGHAHHAFFKDAMLGRFYAICNCCSCCCGAIRAQKNGTPMLVSSGYVCEAAEGECLACGECVEDCPFGALRLDGDGAIRIDTEACMGCGVCVSKCPNGVLSLRRDESRPEALTLNYASMIQEAT